MFNPLAYVPTWAIVAWCALLATLVLMADARSRRSQ